MNSTRTNSSGINLPGRLNLVSRPSRFNSSYENSECDDLQPNFDPAPLGFNGEKGLDQYKILTSPTDYKSPTREPLSVAHSTPKLDKGARDLHDLEMEIQRKKIETKRRELSELNKTSASYDYVNSVRIKHAERIASVRNIRSRPVEVIDPLLFSQDLPYMKDSNATPDYSKLPADRQEQLRIKFWTKFDILLESKPDWKIQLPDANASLEVLHAAYNDQRTRILAKSGAEKWKIGMVIFSVIIEGLINKFTRFDITGFAEYQTAQLSADDTLLIELGEKYASKKSGSATPEMKMAIMIGSNAFIFIAMKVISDLTGMHKDTIMNLIEKFAGTTNKPAPGTKMGQRDVYEPEDIPANPVSEQEQSKIMGILGTVLGVKDTGSMAATAAKLGSVISKKQAETKSKKRLPKTSMSR